MTHPPDTTGLCLVVCAVDSPGGGGAQGFRAWVAERLLSAGALDLCRRADKVREIQDMQLYTYRVGSTAIRREDSTSIQTIQSCVTFHSCSGSPHFFIWSLASYCDGGSIAKADSRPGPSSHRKRICESFAAKARALALSLDRWIPQRGGGGCSLATASEPTW